MGDGPANPDSRDGEELLTLLQTYVGRVEALWAENARQTQAESEALRRTVTLLEGRVADLESLTGKLSGVLEEIRRSTYFRSALPRSLRPSLEERESDTLERARRGETAPEIAAAQRRPIGEVELILRLATGRRPAERGPAAAGSSGTRPAPPSVPDATTDTGTGPTLDGEAPRQTEAASEAAVPGPVAQAGFVPGTRGGRAEEAIASDGPADTSAASPGPGSRAMGARRKNLPREGPAEPNDTPVRDGRVLKVLPLAVGPGSAARPVSVRMDPDGAVIADRRTGGRKTVLPQRASEASEEVSTPEPGTGLHRTIRQALLPGP